MIYIDPTIESCFGTYSDCTWHVVCPKTEKCQVAEKEAIESDAGSAIIIELETDPPECFGSGAHLGDWQEGGQYETCCLDFCDYFPHCANDGTIEILEEIEDPLCLGRPESSPEHPKPCGIGSCQFAYFCLNGAIEIEAEDDVMTVMNFSCFGGCGEGEDPCLKSPCEYEEICWEHVFENIDGTMVVVEEADEARQLGK